MNIYEISQERLRLENIVEENGGEITEELQKEYEINQDNYVQKFENSIHVIQYKELQIQMINSEKEFYKQKIKECDEKTKVLENTINRIKTNLKDFMQLFNFDKVETKINKISFRNSKSVEIFDEQLLPTHCIKVEVKPISKTEIRKMIENGEEIAGARIVESKNLTIK